MRKKKYFGTDGIRGRFGSSMINRDFMIKLGWAAGMVLSQEADEMVLVGHDTRTSCGILESGLQSGLSAAGVHVKLLGVLPTPAIAYLTHSFGACAGLSISASHNSFGDNGVKFFDWQGMKLSDDLEVEIETQLDRSFISKKIGDLGTVEGFTDAAGCYIEFCKSVFPSSLSLGGLRLVLDCANGATFQVAPKIFRELGAEVICLHHTPNGENINVGCGATNVSSLQTAVKQYQADAGLAFDGDGDRLIMVDQKGALVDGDEILFILAKDRLSSLGNQTGVVGTVMSNLALEQSINASGLVFERAAVGDRYVLEKLLERGWVLGGEASGHIVDLDYTTTSDGIIAGLQVLRIILVTEKPLHVLKKNIVKTPQVLINTRIDQPIDLESNEKILKAIQKAELDLEGKGRVLLRLSGTEPLIRVMVEGNQESIVRHTAETLVNVVKDCIH